MVHPICMPVRKGSVVKVVLPSNCMSGEPNTQPLRREIGSAPKRKRKLRTRTPVRPVSDPNQRRVFDQPFNEKRKREDNSGFRSSVTSSTSNPIASIQESQWRSNTEPNDTDIEIIGQYFRRSGELPRSRPAVATHPRPKINEKPIPEPEVSDGH